MKSEGCHLSYLYIILIYSSLSFLLHSLSTFFSSNLIFLLYYNYLARHQLGSLNDKKYREWPRMHFLNSNPECDQYLMNSRHIWSLNPANFLLIPHSNPSNWFCIPRVSLLISFFTQGYTPFSMFTTYFLRVPSLFSKLIRNSYKTKALPLGSGLDVNSLAFGGRVGACEDPVASVEACGPN